MTYRRKHKSMAHTKHKTESNETAPEGTQMMASLEKDLKPAIINMFKSQGNHV